MYFSTFKNSFSDYWSYLVKEVSTPSWHNYFYWLIGLSVFVLLLEWSLAWRRKQAKFRKDFWLDGFYLFFNFFLFSLVGYHAVSSVAVDMFNDLLRNVFGITNLVAVRLHSLPVWVQLVAMLLIRDFIQFNIHRLLHRVPWLWEFHKVHHSVEQMGFAAHLRFHWVETIVYRTIEYLPLAMLGFSITDFFVIHILTLTIGHINHANLDWDYGPLKYVLNNPRMHIWHHAKVIPNQFGVNFGLTFSFWDYLFKTDYVPSNGRDVELGFDGLEKFPKTLAGQLIYPLGRNRDQ